jgi:competence protein ComEC
VQKAPLFITLKERMIFWIVLLFILLGSLAYHYYNYQKLIEKPIYYTTAIVLKQYIKTKDSGKTYTVLKLKDKNGFLFYITSYQDLRELKMHHVNVALITKSITFLDSIKSFFAPSFNLGVLPKEPNLRRDLASSITVQHQDKNLASLFSALFIAIPLEYEMRQSVTTLGIAHLTALSGYHLGLLSTILFFLLKIVYSPLHKRYFPYRNIYFDLGALILIILFGFLLLADSPPSLLRAYIMMALAFFMLYFWLDIFSFETLSIVIGLILAFFPALFFSIGFWFSISGVFFIYLFVNHFKEQKVWWHIVMLNVYLYFAMLPIVHYIFPTFALSQLASIPLSLLFTLFYPLEIVLHLLGYGGVFDSWLLILFSYSSEIKEILTPLWFLIFYIGSCLFAIFYKKMFYLTFVLMGGFYGFILLPFDQIY